MEKTIKKELNEDYGVAVRVPIGDLNFWIDCNYDHEEEEWSFDWNQYIFHLTDSEDVKRKEMQEDIENFELAVTQTREELTDEDILFDKGVKEKQAKRYS